MRTRNQSRMASKDKSMNKNQTLSKDEQGPGHHEDNTQEGNADKTQENHPVIDSAGEKVFNSHASESDNHKSNAENGDYCSKGASASRSSEE